MNKILIIIIIFYQKNISPFKTATCRFYPSCSDYTIQAIQKFGCLKGIYLAMRRVLRCHPFHAGGYDPVPDRKTSVNIS